MNIYTETLKLLFFLCNQKSLKIQNGLSEFVYRRRTDRKPFTYIIIYHIFRILIHLENKQFTFYMWLEDWLTSSQQYFSYVPDKIKLNNNGCERRCAGRVGSSCFTFGTGIIAATMCLLLYVTHYVQQSACPHCNLTTLHREDNIIHHHGTCWVLDCGNRHLYTSVVWGRYLSEYVVSII